MGLRLKFNLVLGFTTLIGLGVSGLFSYQLLQQNAQEEVLQTARIMMESAVAVRGYTVNEVRPLLAVQQRRQFIPQTVPAYAAHRYVATLQQEHPEYSYKEATLNPTNPANKATEWETDIITYFRNHNSDDELIGDRITPTGPSLYLSRPIEIKNESCLSCHGRPVDAPETLINTYGDSNGFGWKVGEVVGAQIVSVPMTLPLERAETAFFTFMISLLGVFLLIGVILNVLLHYIVIKPVKALSHRADEVSMGALEVEEIPVKGNDEIASLSRSFNRMHRSLGNAVKMLDETMDD